MSMVSLPAWRAARARGESLCPHQSSFELIISLPGQSVPLPARKIMLLSALQAAEFRAGQGRGRERWVARGGEDEATGHSRAGDVSWLPAHLGHGRGHGRALVSAW